MADPIIDPNASWPLRPICPPDFFEQLQKTHHQTEDYNHLIARTINELCNFVTASGAFVQVGGVIYYKDTLRDKFLSTHRVTLPVSWCGLNLKDRYLKIGEVTTMDKQGFFLPRAACITGIWAKSRSTGSWALEARKNGSPITLVSVAITAGSGSNVVLDVDLDAGDNLQTFLSGSAVAQPIGAIEIAWRLP